MRFSAALIVLAIIFSCCSRSSNLNEDSLNTHTRAENSLNAQVNQTIDTSGYVQTIKGLMSYCTALDSNNQWSHTDTVESIEGIRSSEGNMAVRQAYDSITRYKLYVFGCGGRAEYSFYLIQNQLKLMRHEEVSYNHPIAQLTDEEQHLEMNQTETHDKFVDYYFLGDAIVFRYSEVNESGFKGLMYSEVVDLAFSNLGTLEDAFDTKEHAQ